MLIEKQNTHVDIYPFSENREDALRSQIRVFTKKTDGEFGRVKFSGWYWTEDDVAKLTAAFAKAFELAKAARENAHETKI